MRSTHRAAETDPLVNGGSYKHRHTGEEGLVMGVQANANTGARYGRLYTYATGGKPDTVVENTASLEDWELIEAPTKGAARALLVAHKKARADAEEARQTALAAAQA